MKQHFITVSVPVSVEWTDEGLTEPRDEPEIDSFTIFQNVKALPTNELYMLATSTIADMHSGDIDGAIEDARYLWVERGFYTGDNYPDGTPERVVSRRYKIVVDRDGRVWEHDS